MEFYRLHICGMNESGRYKILHRPDLSKPHWLEWGDLPPDKWECVGVYDSKKWAVKDLRKYRQGSKPRLYNVHNRRRQISR